MTCLLNSIQLATVLLHFRCHLHILLMLTNMSALPSNRTTNTNTYIAGQAATVVCRECHVDSVVDIEPLWVMINLPCFDSEHNAARTSGLVRYSPCQHTTPHVS